MNRKKKLAILRIAGVLLVMALLLSGGALPAAAETAQPYASSYFDSYNAYISLRGNGNIRVYFTVTGTGTLEALGALTIHIYESTDNSNWTWKKAYTHKTFPDMMGYNDFFYANHVDYQGVAGRYYRAYVCIWAGSLTVGDTRYFYTSSKLAT